MPHSKSIIQYPIIFAIILALVALFPRAHLARAIRILIVLYVPVAAALSIYYLAIKRDMWQETVANGETEDVTRYSRATARSSTIYVVINISLLVGAKVLGISYSSVGYNYAALLVTTLITYVYDRCVATEDGLSHFKQEPARTVLNAYLSFCSPSFMRYLIVIACQIALMILISYYVGSLIPPHCWVASSLFRKSIVPLVVFAIIGGPLRFAWAYPTVSLAARIPYLLAYTIAFVILGVVTYMQPCSLICILVFMGLIATLLQMGGISDAPHEPDVFEEANALPLWLMLIFSTLILVSVLLVSYRVFVSYLQPFILDTSSNSVLAACRHNTKSHRYLSQKKHVSNRRSRLS